VLVTTAADSPLSGESGASAMLWSMLWSRPLARRVAGRLGAAVDDRRLILELDPGSEPITGRLRDGSGVERPFAGYVELISALEELRRATPPAAAPEPA